MSAVEVLTPVQRDQGTASPTNSAPAAETPPAGTAPVELPPSAAQQPRDDVVDGILAQADTRERFIPVTRAALMERLTRPQSWRGNEAKEARRFFRYLDYWRQASYS